MDKVAFNCSSAPKDEGQSCTPGIWDWNCKGLTHAIPIVQTCQLFSYSQEGSRSEFQLNPGRSDTYSFHVAPTSLLTSLFPFSPSPYSVTSLPTLLSISTLLNSHLLLYSCKTRPTEKSLNESINSPTYTLNLLNAESYGCLTYSKNTVFYSPPPLFKKVSPLRLVCRDIEVELCKRKTLSGCSY